MGSLLAHIFSRIKGSPEDVATMSLCYILDESKTARKVLSDYLSTVCGIEPFPELFFRTQVVGAGKERPDLAGIDGNMNEHLLCEAKFWAGLTDNQPQAYLARLKSNTRLPQKALVFICPHMRIVSLWNELLRLCQYDGFVTDGATEDVQRIQLGDVTMAIVSWRSMSDLLMQSLSVEHSPLTADLQQLVGLCEEMDEKAFVPFKQEDFGKDKERRITSYYRIVDTVTHQLMKKLNASTKNLKATAQYAGYSRYMIINGCAVSVQFNCRYWEKFAETPFWISLQEISNGKWVSPVHIRGKLSAYENCVPKRLFIPDYEAVLTIPLFAPAYHDEQEVVRVLVLEISEIFNLIGNTAIELTSRKRNLSISEDHIEVIPAFQTGDELET